MRYTYQHIISRIGEKGYFDLVAIFLTLGFENVNDIPDILWESAIVLYEENMFKNAA